MPALDSTVALRLKEIRQGAMMIASVPETGLHPDADPAFWRALAEIEAAAGTGDRDKGEWLAGFTQVDDLGPMGRGLILATAALEALRLMPDLALAQAVRIMAAL